MSTLYQELQPVSSPYPPYQQSPLPEIPELAEIPEPVRRPWKFMAALSYIVVPLAIGADEKNSPVNKVDTFVAAVVLIAVAYALSFILALFQYHQRKYLLHSIFIPCLISNMVGLLNVILNILCRNLLPIGRLATVSLALPCGFGFIYALCALWVYALDVLDETRISRGDRETPLLTEDEQQRQQLLRLLQKDQSKKRWSAKSTKNTFQVQVPERINPGKGWDTFKPGSSPRDEGYYS
ncbi:hypothetical protein FE257_003893 [Aspergillus nanangensis]|uniref:Uncharacterized protein n=1 Tax=Aspergillus nanangensis TaxID=2582783 RepID=A0AAD4CC82_ASPNN|nr:hypothetical protein FE257_003893 [Aspergillus nanangensis]